MSKSTSGSNRTTRPAISRRAFLKSVGTTGTASALTLVSAGVSPTKAAAQSAAPKAGPFLPPKVKASSPLKITWWNWQGFHLETQRKVAAEYKRLYDQNVDLESTTYQDPVQTRSAVRTALVGGSGPDLICALAGPDLITLSQSGHILSYTEMFKGDPEWEKSFFPFVHALHSVNNEVWQVTPIANAVGLWYNKGFFERKNLKVPTNLDELKSVAEVFKKDGLIPVALPGGNTDFVLFIYYWMVNGMGLGDMMLQADLGKQSWTAPELVDAMRKYEDLAKSGPFPPAVLSVKEPDAITMLAAGKAAMAVFGNWGRTTLARAKQPDAQFGFTMLPAVKAGGPQVGLPSVGIGLAINKNSKNRDIAISFARFVSTGRGRLLYVGGVGIPPSGPLTPEEEKEVAAAVNDPVWKECIEVGSKATGLRHIFTPKVDEALRQACAAVITGRGKPDEVLAQVEAASKAAGKRDFTVPPWTL